MAKGLDAMVEAEKEPFSDFVTTVNSYAHIKHGSTQVHFYCLSTQLIHALMVTIPCQDHGGQSCSC